MPSFETAARSFKVEPIMAPVHGDVSRPVAWLDGMVEILVSDNREG
jgi:hypothetical protein